MKSFLRLSLLASVLGFGASAQAQSAYLETASLSILWNFTVTGVSGTTIGPTPIVPGTPGTIDPEALRPTDRITTDIGTPIVYDKGNGDQAFFSQQLLRTLLESYAEAYLAEARNGNGDPVLLAFLKDRITYLKDSAASGRWELTAVRETQPSVESLTTTPYQIFLTRIDRVSAKSPSRNFDTGLRLVPIYSAGSSVETLADGTLRKATGNYTTHFRLQFASFYAGDPLSAIPLSEFEPQVVETEDGFEIEPVDIVYNTQGGLWVASATGYMTYAIRSTPGPIVAVAPTRMKITGHGSWWNALVTPTTPARANGQTLPEWLDTIAHESESTLIFNGIAPLSIKMGEVKYQNRNLFPDFSAD